MLQGGCSVSSEGDTINLKVARRDGSLCELVLTFDEASSLAMTLPRLLKMAFRRKFPDDALRHVYGLSSYLVECASDLHHLIVTLSVADGFEVAFAVKVESAQKLAQELISGSSILNTSGPTLPH